MKALIARITSGEIREGEALPSEMELTARFEVSRGVVRECLRGLEERGMIEVRHGRGATAAPSRDWNVFDPDVLEAVLAARHAAELRTEWRECRRIVEESAAGLAAQRATAEDLRAMSDSLARMRDSLERQRINPAAREDFIEADLDFHRAVVDAAGNRSLGRLAEPINRALTAAEGRARIDAGQSASAVTDHTRILNAIAHGDAEQARAAMSDHLSARTVRPRPRPRSGSPQAA
jgi:DNA-binding FadR family transcriptional regulator